MHETSLRFENWFSNSYDYMYTWVFVQVACFPELSHTRPGQSAQANLAHSCGSILYFLCTKAGTVIAPLSHHNSVCLSVRLSHGWISQKRCMLGSSNFYRQASAAWKTLVSRSVKLFHKFKRGHPKQGC